MTITYKNIKEATNSISKFSFCIYYWVSLNDIHILIDYIIDTVENEEEINHERDESAEEVAKDSLVYNILFRDFYTLAAKLLINIIYYLYIIYIFYIIIIIAKLILSWNKYLVIFTVKNLIALLLIGPLELSICFTCKNMIRWWEIQVI